MSAGLPPRPPRPPRPGASQSLGQKETQKLRVITSIVLLVVTVLWAVSHAKTVLYPVKISDVAFDDPLPSTKTADNNVEIVIVRPEAA